MNHQRAPEVKGPRMPIRTNAEQESKQGCAYQHRRQNHERTHGQ